MRAVLSNPAWYICFAILLLKSEAASKPISELIIAALVKVSRIKFKGAKAILNLVCICPTQEVKPGSIFKIGVVFIKELS